jgi:hypothetical protein
MRARGVALLSTAALLLSSGPAAATLTHEGIPYPTGSAPYSVYVADFNLDGRPDLVTANGDSANASVFLRNVVAGFTQEGGSPFATATSSGAVGDVNGDGRPDLVVAGYVEGVVVVRVRSAIGGFASEPNIPAGQATAVAIADFNSDGRNDLATTSFDSDDVKIFLRNPANTGFVAGPTYPTGDQPRDVAVADLNGDGKKDLAVISQGPMTVRSFLGTGNGTFLVEGLDLSTGAAPTEVATGDFDGNGRPDLAVTNLGSDSVSVYLRNPANTGFTPLPGSPFAVGDTPASLAVADLDLDGHADIAAATASGVDVLQRTATSFTRLAPTPIGASALGVAVGDFDQDGVPDVAATAISNTLHVLLGSIPPLDAPRKGELNLVPVSGTVRVKLKGADRFVVLQRPMQVEAGVQIDASTGTLAVVGPGEGTSAKVGGTLLRTSQAKKVTTLRLSAMLGCGGGKAAKSRTLAFKGKGDFKVRGSFSQTLPGKKATYSVKDTCTSTTTRVKRGKVTLTDFVLKTKVTVRSGDKYVARKRA